MTPVLQVGKIPHELLERIIRSSPTQGPRVLLGPGVGLDSAVLEFGETCLVLKTEPITFASDNIGWYAVQIAANDIATTGAVPSWAMFSVLLPEGSTTEESLTAITDQLSTACRTAGITVVGGHTEITHGLDRPIIVTSLLGEVPRDKLVTPAQAQPGDALLLTKGVPIEAVAILAREFPHVLEEHLNEDELLTAQNYLYNPGISVLKDAQTALRAGKITAMHDPTEEELRLHCGSWPRPVKKPCWLTRIASPSRHYQPGYVKFLALIRSVQSHPDPCCWRLIRTAPRQSYSPLKPKVSKQP